MTTTSEAPTTADLQKEARDAVLAAITKAARAYDRNHHGGNYVKDLAEALAFVAAIKDPVKRPPVAIA